MNPYFHVTIEFKNSFQNIKATFSDRGDAIDYFLNKQKEYIHFDFKMTVKDFTPESGKGRILVTTETFKPCAI